MAGSQDTVNSRSAMHTAELLAFGRLGLVYRKRTRRMGVGVRQELDEPQGDELLIFFSWLTEQISSNERGSALDQVQRRSDRGCTAFRAGAAGSAGRVHAVTG